MTTTPTLNGQVIGQAERATRAVLERLLAETDTPFIEWVTINVLATRGGSVAADALVEQVATGLIVDPTIARHALDHIIETGLAAPEAGGERVELTPSGTARFEQISAGVTGISERLYADLSEADLVTARTVLETLTERARAELTS